jgi:hypothetical protein
MIEYFGRSLTTNAAEGSILADIELLQREASLGRLVAAHFDNLTDGFGQILAAFLLGMGEGHYAGTGQVWE